MKQHDCIDTIGQVPRMPADPPALGELWLAWLAGRLRRLPDAAAGRGSSARASAASSPRWTTACCATSALSRSAAFAETQKWFWQP